ncbi:tail fiber protein [Bartonella krasnovii]|uniref:Phage tail protein n=1 Tax=Bartonella krasnovii TaxID=2267275 RepID=A0A5B9D1G2_9HYPH|nr:tail fiber protein [Bartonella krasnovii]QEE12267.1 phage tail protein [Bartonella krasnovii]UNF29796.1 tail fiber protein [Bartonella krasnovii]UNF36156.1 tail fiber protein [Bartonella krasnovii]UNF37863.1 tail fiber protein [Bartonella krasnovii]UNF41262.1 tail fiber protein [Bartonella krasnovii]
MSTIYDWSLRAADNTRADDLIDWSEGQHPSRVNTSARFMMQRVKEYLLDTGGTLEGIVTNDYAEQTTLIRLESQTAFLEYKNGIVLCFMATGKNIGATTLSLNALEGKPVYKATEFGIGALSGGEIQQGCIYTLVYHGDHWYLMNPTSIPLEEESSLYPTGFIGTFGMRAIPKGWLLCDGKAYSRNDYSELFATIGTVWGEGNSVTTFNVPDFRGMFLRGLDSGRSIDANRRFASVQTDLIESHQHQGQSLSFPHFTSNEDFWDGNTTAVLGYRMGLFGGSSLASFMGIERENLGGYIASPYSLDEDQEVDLRSTGEGETRPVNVSVLFAIKT